MRESALASLQFAESFGIPLSDDCLRKSLRSASTDSHSSLFGRTDKRSIHLGLTKQVEVFLELFRVFLALSILFAEGIGDTIRVSYTPSSGESRIQEVRIA